MLDACDLADLRDVDESAMPSRCRVLQRPDVLTGGRVTAGVEVQLGPTTRCRLQAVEREAVERGAVGRLGDETSGTLALPIGTAVSGGHRVEVTTEVETPAGLQTFVETFEVVGDPWVESLGTSLLANLTREG